MKHQFGDWHPATWRAFPSAHQPDFPDAQALRAVLDEIAALPPLVLPEQVENLKGQLQLAARGEAVVLQAGDCAEAFDECHAAKIGQQLRVITQMGVILSYFLDKPTIKIGRIAGQYAKPRSTPTEWVDGRSVPIFLGDNVNGDRLDERTPDPKRLLKAYFHAGATLNHLQALGKMRAHECYQVPAWERSLIHHPGLSDRTALAHIVDVFTAHFADDARFPVDDFFTSHEGLILASEERQTRYVAKYDGWYNLSCHMLWIGERTRALTGGHVEYFRGIANPVGVKVGPDADIFEILALVRKLNPHNVAGKIALITRFGKKHTSKMYPLLKAVREAGLEVLWLSDPMHGNTQKLESGLKTRDLADIGAELRDAFAMHRLAGSHLNGVHLELSGEAITECMGGSEDLRPEQLGARYRSKCDPRLNYGQSLDMAMLFAELAQAGIDGHALHAAQAAEFY